jgi:hypothetical protein
MIVAECRLPHRSGLRLNVQWIWGSTASRVLDIGFTTNIRRRSTIVSMILAVLDGAVLAQVGNPTPEAPPMAEKILQLGRYFTWMILLSGVTAITYGGGRFAWEKWSGGGLQSPKMIASAMAGGAVATSAGTIMNAVIGA